MEIAGYNIPEDLYYDERHFWVRVEGDELVIGMDDFAEKLAKVESGKWLGTVYSPADGEVTAVNEELEANPGLINSDCYGKGWMYRIKPSDMSQINSLIHGGKDVLEPWLLEDVKKFKKD